LVLYDSAEDVSQSKTKSTTFRLGIQIVQELQKEADQGEISLNVLVNQILRRYIEWDRYEKKLNLLPIPKLMLVRMIDETLSVAENANISDLDDYRNKIARNAAEIAFNIMKDSVILMKKEYNLWSVLDVLRKYMKVAGITSDHTVEHGRKHVFVIQHELGENWSLFAKELLSLIFAQLAQVKADISATPRTVKAEINL
jgi:hypothetical protein